MIAPSASACDSSKQYQTYVLNGHSLQREGKINKENAKGVIIRARLSFEKTLLKYHGPAIIPTVFRNHPDRYLSVRERDRALHAQRNPYNPPKLPRYRFEFAEEVYSNVHYNLRQNNKAYIKHAMFAKDISLNRDFCLEDAFEEVILRRPYLYSEDMERVKLSNYADPDPKNWAPRTDAAECKNTCHFTVDFSFIFPESKVSTAVILCYECGQFAETVLGDKMINLAKKEIWENICKLNFSTINDEPKRFVLRLDLRSCVLQGCSFVEGLMAVTALSAGNPLHPSLFVRTRLHFYCTPRSLFGRAIHGSSGEEGLHPDHAEYMERFGIY